MDKNSQQSKQETYFFMFLFVVIALLLFKILLPLSGPILFGGILAGTFLPLKRHLKEKYPKWSQEKTSIIICLIITVGLIVPGVLLSIQVSKEAINVYGNIQEFIENGKMQNFLFGEGKFASLLNSVSHLIGVHLTWETLQDTLLGYGQKFSSTLLNTLNYFIGNVLKFLFNFFITMLTVYGLLAEGTNLKKYVFALSPLPEEDEKLLLDRFNQMNYVSLVCNGVGGIIQGGIAGIIFFVLGVGSPFLLTSIMIVLAFIPLLGISIIYIPVTFFLFLEDRVFAGIILFVLCTVLALWAENWFKPKFIGDRIKINSLFVLMTIVGGMSAFGITGVFYGPLIGIMFLTIATMYSERF
ncbi:MAG: AI-2E family transporter [Halobacteriovoraceae bacterium]|nr:AI-2E family transporter [Halobacteriovoraceae bacterium]MCB9093608.1 AI-2E family transporter [Halobacteriovoraceae bacterium]